METDEVLVIIEVQKVFDEDLFCEYRAQAREQLLACGGRLLGRGGSLFEGTPSLGFSVLVQRWPSEAAFRSWQQSEAYAPLLTMRSQAAQLRIIIVPAVD